MLLFFGCVVLILLLGHALAEKRRWKRFVARVTSLSAAAALESISELEGSSDPSDSDLAWWVILAHREAIHASRLSVTMAEVREEVALELAPRAAIADEIDSLDGVDPRNGKALMLYLAWLEVKEKGLR